MEFEKVKKIIGNIIDIDVNKITLESTFEDMRVDSLDLVEIVMAIEDAFNITIEPGEDMQTVEDLIRYIRESK
ncbi:MAG: acyl carrier protein [Clostridiales bacterium]|nr:acyl carrier protein [Clostridiales bacterium]MBP3939890.1 acyl carrier protein [Christensenellaceae bacterium]MBR3841710.1 acyl carrier protein [Christensenellaceae bacterium]